MGKFDKFNHLNEISGAIQTMADCVGVDVGKIVGTGLTMATAGAVIAGVVAPAMAGPIIAGSLAAGMAIEYLRGRHAKKIAQAMTNANLTPEGPAFISGEYGTKDFQAFQQQMKAQER